MSSAAVMPHPRTLFFGAAAGDGTPGVSPGAAESGWQPRTLGPLAGANAPPRPQRGADTGAGTPLDREQERSVLRRVAAPETEALHHLPDCVYLGHLQTSRT